MKTIARTHTLFPSRLAFLALASAIAIPALAQQPQPSPTSAAVSSSTAAKEGFWGRVNPFARKKWVNNRVAPLKGQLNELDEVNARNGRDIQDVDSRAQVGIRQAQSTADAASQTASAAGTQAQKANSTAQGAAGHLDQLNLTVSGLDQYRQANELEVTFHSSQPVLTAAARKQLDEFAAGLANRPGYVLEIEGRSPLASTAGIQSSGRLAEAVKRYLVTQDQIPVYRLHTVALGNAPAAGSEEARPVKASSVCIRLMENSLAAQAAASPHDAAALTGAERP